MRTIKKERIQRKKNTSKTKSSNDKDVTEFAFQKIKQMMYQNNLVPGQKIFYHDIALKLNLSITPIVNALGRLAMLKLVSYETNRGYFVRMITENETRELYKTREALETFIIPEVIKKIDSKKLDSIKSAFKKHDNLRNPYHRRLILMRDLDLHLKIVKIAENTVLYDMLKQIIERIYLGYRPEFITDDRIKLAVKEHRGILDALARRDTDTAVKAIINHINSGMNYVLKSIRDYYEEDLLKEYDSL